MPLCKSCGVDGGGRFCHGCGTPFHSTPANSETPQPTAIASANGKSAVSPWMIAGLVFMPSVFAWFTLRRGFSSRVRTAAFCWLGFLLLFGLSQNVTQRRASDPAFSAVGEPSSPDGCAGGEEIRHVDQRTGEVRILCRSTCSLATPQLQALCPKAKELSRCVASDDTYVMMPPRQVAVLQPGHFVSFGTQMGPVWFVTSGGELVSVNGIAKSLCYDSVPDAIAFVGKRLRDRAAQRGSSAETYEGVYRAGGYVYQDCSRFEIEVGSIYHRELWQDSDEPEKRAMARAAKKAHVPYKMGEDIYAKVSALCYEAVQ
jgi:hypothetical protein